MHLLLRSAASLVAIGTSLQLAACGATSTPGAAAASSSSSPAQVRTASIKIGTSTQTVLKDAKGLTLYYFTPDGATTIKCTGGCATSWPPLLATSAIPTSNPALPGKLTVVNGPNGNQIAYNGHPLYTYSKDGDSSDAYGQGIGGKWFVATPDLASAVQASASDSTPPTTY